MAELWSSHQRFNYTYFSRICQATCAMTALALTLQLNIILSYRCFGDAFQKTLVPRLPSFMPLLRLSESHSATSYYNHLIRKARGGMTRTRKTRPVYTLRMATINSNDLDDPYKILGIPFGEMDKSVIKRAYRRMAMKYHPDVAAKDNSDPDARKRANERFIKINAAYELLSGKTGAQNSAGKSKSDKNSSSTYTQPPHRRAASQTRTSNRDYTSENWRDFFPRDFAERYNVRDDDEYGTDGDSYSKIFSDLFEGIASGAGSAVGSSGGILNDLIEFLEGNYADAGGFGVSSSKRADEEMLRDILSSNNVDLIREEIDDTSLLIQQLETKLNNVESEIAALQMDIQSPTVRFFEREMKEEEVAALKARKDVVEDYLKRGRKRLVKLQLKYKEMRSGVGSNGAAPGDAPNRSSSNTYDNNPSSRTSASSREGFGSSGRGRSSNGRSSAGVSSDVNEPFSTASTSTRESFGSFGRGRGSSSARSRTRAEADRRGASSPSSRTNTEASYSERRHSRASQPSSSSPSSSSSVSSTSTTNSKLPPHRRSTSTSWKEKRQETQRLQEIKVDEEFDKLKREMGL